VNGSVVRRHERYTGTLATMSSTPTNHEDSRHAAVGDEFAMTPARVLRTARKYLPLVLACLVGVGLLTTFWSLGQRKIYRAETLLRLDPDPPKPLGQKVELVSGSSSYWNHREFFESEYRIMRSMRVAIGAVRALGLHSDPGFLDAKDREHFKPVAPEEAAGLLISRLSVEAVKDSSLAVLRYEDTDPKRCQVILTTVARVYLAQNLEANTTVSTNAVEWLNGQLDHLKVDLEKSEVALNDFRQKNNVLSISLEDRHNMITAQLEQIAKEMTALEIKRFDHAARYSELASIKSKDPMKVGATELLQSVVLNSLRVSHSEQARNLDELVANLGENHPKVLAAKAKLETTADSIRAEIVNIQSAAAKDLRSLDRQIGDLKKKDEDIQKQAHELQAFEVPYNQLERTKKHNEKIYGLVLERARETDLTRMINFNNIRVVDEPIVPKSPIRPNVPVNIVVGCLLGLGLGVALALLRELTDRSLKTPAEVEAMGVSCLGLLPEIEKAHRPRRSNKTSKPTLLGERDLIVAARPDGGVAEAARAIRTNLAFMSPDRPYTTLLLTSAIPEEGKTTVACSLSTVLAQSGLRVLLVDTDLRRPRLHRTFRKSNDLGVTMAISGQAPIEECIQETDIPNLSVLTSGPIPPNPAELLDSIKFKELTIELRRRFDRVVYDSPPILPVTDAAILSQLVDGVVVVSRGFSTQKAAVRQALRLLKDVKSRLVGVVLNAIELSRHDYREYHYYYKRDGYYVAHDEVPTTHQTGPEHTQAH